MNGENDFSMDLLESIEEFDTANSAVPDPQDIDPQNTEGLEVPESEGDNDIFGNPPDSTVDEGKAAEEQVSDLSPNSLLSSVAKACYEDGLFPDLSEEEIQEIKDSESFAIALKKQITAGLSSEQKKLKEMLEVGMSPDEIDQYEGTLEYLNSISSDSLEQESDEATATRKKLIYNDYISRGFTKERAQRAVERSISDGTDIEDAKLALESCIDFYTNEYDKLITEKKAARDKEIKAQETKLSEFKSKVLNTETPFDGLALDKKARETIYNNMTKATYKADNGQPLTPIQKYIQDNPLDAQYYISMMYTLTDGFKNIDNLTKQKLASEKKSALKKLEQQINNTRIADNGSVDFSDTGDANSFDILKHWDNVTNTF